MLSTLFNEFYWLGLIISVVFVYIVISVKKMDSFEPISKLNLLLFVPVFLSWYYVVIILIWHVLLLLWIFVKWLINDITTFFE